MTAGNDLKVSLIVTVRNDAAGAAELLDALAGQTRLPDEIVIVDGGSTDGTQAVLSAFSDRRIAFRWLECAGANIASGRNRAIQEARHDLIACTDCGCLPDADWLEELVRPFADANVAVVGGNYRVIARTSHERVLGALTMPGALAPVDPARFNPSARSLAFRRSAWEQAGGFPAWLATAEDTLFACKLRRLHLPYAHAAAAIVRWRPRRTLPATWRQFREYARGEALIGRGCQNAAFWTRRYVLAGLCAVMCAAALGTAEYGWAALAGATWFCALVGPIHRRAAQVARRTGRCLDYGRALLLSHWVTLATLRGFRLGRRQRTQDPQTYVNAMRAYWGDASLAAAPPWNMKQPLCPRTLIVSWHWPPANRASTVVLANLFAAAPPGAFWVLTRTLSDRDADPVVEPPIPTERVRCWLADEKERTLLTPIAALIAAWRMTTAAQRMHRDAPFQRVLAVHPHRWSLLAGWWISRRLGIPLAAYMHDLCAETLITRNPLKRSFWTSVDERALRSAFLILTPTREFAVHYRGRNLLETWVLPHCRPAADAAPQDEAPRHGPLRLLYAGNIYQAHADAVRALLDALRQAPAAGIEFLSRPHPVLANHPVRWVDRETAQAAMRCADVLVVALSGNSPYPREIQGCFPSKLVDYLSAGKPILAIVPPNCFVERFVVTTGCGIVVTSQHPAEIARAIERLRDPASRKVMGRAARHVAGQLDAERWMEQLCRRLALGAPIDPSTPAFPVARAPHAVRSAVVAHAQA